MFLVFQNSSEEKFGNSSNLLTYVYLAYLLYRAAAKPTTPTTKTPTMTTFATDPGDPTSHPKPLPSSAPHPDGMYEISTDFVNKQPRAKNSTPNTTTTTTTTTTTPSLPTPHSPRTLSNTNRLSLSPHSICVHSPRNIPAENIQHDPMDTDPAQPDPINVYTLVERRKPTKPSLKKTHDHPILPTPGRFSQRRPSSDPQPTLISHTHGKPQKNQTPPFLTTATSRAEIASNEHPFEQGWWQWKLQVEIPEKNAAKAPIFVQKLTSVMLSTEPGSALSSLDNHPISLKDFANADFLETFHVQTTKNRLSAFFKLTSQQSFHSIKTTPSIWKLLKDHDIYLRRLLRDDAPTQTKNLGFWCYVHPQSTSSRVFEQELRHTLASQAPTSKPDDSDYNPIIPPFQCSHGRISATSGNNHLSRVPAIIQSTDAAASNSHHLLSLLTKLCESQSREESSSASNPPVFVPLHYKFTAPALWFEFVRLQNNFLQQHHTVPLLGLSAAHLDTTLPNSTKSLYSAITSIKGVLRLDPCRLTPIEGRWNLSTRRTLAPDIQVQIDALLAHAVFPASLPTFDKWPVPTRRPTTRSVPASSADSVYSSLTGDFSTDSYARSLAQHSPPSDVNNAGQTQSKPLRSAWHKPPSLRLEQIEFVYDVSKFPSLPTRGVAFAPSSVPKSPTTSNPPSQQNSKTKHTRSTASSVTETTRTMHTAESFVSPLSEPKSNPDSMEDFIKLIEHQDAAVDKKLKRLQARIAQIQTQVDSLEDRISAKIMESLCAADGPLTTQRTMIDTRMSQMESMMTSLASSLSQLTAQLAATTSITTNDSYTPVRARDAESTGHSPAPKRHHTSPQELTSPEVLFSTPTRRRSPSIPPSGPVKPSQPVLASDLNKGKQE